jgi:hypothetical protein
LNAFGIYFHKNSFIALACRPRLAWRKLGFVFRGLTNNIISPFSGFSINFQADM